MGAALRALAALVSLSVDGHFAAEAGEATVAPVLDTDFPDPFVLPDGGGLIAFATNTDRPSGPLHVQMSRSVDGRRWSEPSEAMPALPPWTPVHDPDIWAPEVLRVGARYVLYFSARHRSWRRPEGLTLCVGAAIAGTPDGPFLPEPEPLTCGGPYGAIDPSPFGDGDDLWLYVKTDGNCCHVPTRFVAQRLTADGLHLAGAPSTLAGVSNDRPWEGAVVEAPEMRRHDGQLLLFFAGNDYAGARYAIGYARCHSAAGPCEQAAENPIVASVGDLVGPGHECVFEFGGRTWMAFAAWRGSGARRYRAMFVVPLEWRDGRPVAALTAR